MKSLNKKKFIEIMENNIKDGIYDYLLPSQFFYGEFNIIHIVEDDSKINWKENGWHIYIVKNVDPVTKSEMGYKDDECLFIQLVNNESGFDHHFLTDEEINDMVAFFLNGGYKINKIG